MPHRDNYPNVLKLTVSVSLLSILYVAKINFILCFMCCLLIHFFICVPWVQKAFNQYLWLNECSSERGFLETAIHLIYSDSNGMSLHFLILCVIAICVRIQFWWDWWQHFKLKIPAQWDSFNTSFLERCFGKLPSFAWEAGGTGKRCVCQQGSITISVSVK